MKRLIAASVIAACMAIAPLSPASAHKSSDSYLSLRVDGGPISGQWNIALRDLDYAIGIDSDNDGDITWANCAHIIGRSRLRIVEPEIDRRWQPVCNASDRPFGR
jgi:hypothetical protein